MTPPWSPSRRFRSRRSVSDMRSSYASGITASTSEAEDAGEEPRRRVAEVAEAATDPARRGRRVATGSETHEPGSRGNEQRARRQGPPASDSGADTTSTYCGHLVGHTRRNASPMTSHSANVRCSRHSRSKPDQREAGDHEIRGDGKVPASWNGTEPISHTSGCHDGQPVSWTAALVA